MTLKVDVNEVLAVLRNQRNTALDEVSIQTARAECLSKRVNELEEQLKPKEPAPQDG